VVKIAQPGFFTIDKPVGWTSFDVVQVVRRTLGVRRVGHAGTLDPLATGVLPVAVLSATRLTDLVHEYTKVYRGTVRLGVTTTTADAEGEVLEERPVATTEAAIREAVGAFIGEIEQVPPAYSAIKVGGVAAYKLAREGKAPELSARTVRIDRIDVLSIALPDVELRITCGQGTYVRSLARDLGVALGCGGHLASLVRESVGPFTLDHAIPGDQFAGLSADNLQARLIPIDQALPGYRRILVPHEAEGPFRTGTAFPSPTPGRLAEMGVGVTLDNRVVGLARCIGGGRWHPEKVFPETVR
jgi:tRNA pseudouridine55 synthase